MPIAAPAIVGIIVGTKAKQKNHVAQGVATGLVYASVSTAMNRFLPSAVTGQEGLSDAMGYNNSSMLADVEPGSLVVSPSGEVQDLQGNLYGKAVLQLEEPKETTSVRANSLELAESWENGEQF